MTSIPAHPSAVNSRPQPAAAAQPAMAIDPVRILRKYRWLLVISAFVGLALGAAGHVLLAKYSPVWRPYALFTVTPPPSSNLVETNAPLNIDEINRFMQTQVKFMTSDVVLQKVVEDLKRLFDPAETVNVVGRDGVQQFRKAPVDIGLDVQPGFLL